MDEDKEKDHNIIRIENQSNMENASLFYLTTIAVDNPPKTLKVSPDTTKTPLLLLPMAGVGWGGGGGAILLV